MTGLLGPGFVYVLPEDSSVLWAEAHQVIKCRLMERAGCCGGGAQGVFIQKEGDEEGQQDGHQLRT